MPNLLVIGGTGFIGSQLSAKLSPLCDKICVPTRNIEANKNLKLIPNLEIIKTNVLDERTLSAIFSDSDIVINTIGILNEFDKDNTFNNLHYELTKKISNAIMTNIIGDQITNYRNKKYSENEFFFDYQKKEIKEKRKMGHITTLI